MALSNSQYDAIMRVYNQRQFQDKREQDKRIAEVYEKDSAGRGAVRRACGDDGPGGEKAPCR